MKVRVFDREKDQYFKSQVYAILGVGIFTRYLVLVPTGEEFYFKLYNELEKSEDGSRYVPNINLITLDGTDEWIKREYVACLKSGPSSKISFRGFSWVLEQADFLASLLEGRSVACDQAKCETAALSDAIEGWNYVNGQADADHLLEAFSGFHDSVLQSLSYVSGSRVLPDGCMHVTDDVRRVSMVFGSQYQTVRIIEMVFEGVLAMNLRPAEDNETSEIFSASIIYQDESVFFCDGEINTEMMAYDGTWIKSLELRWKFI